MGSSPLVVVLFEERKRPWKIARSHEEVMKFGVTHAPPRAALANGEVDHSSTVATVVLRGTTPLDDWKSDWAILEKDSKDTSRVTSEIDEAMCVL